ncbi:hypothetical protein ACTHR6_24835 [Ralstonia holmesii]|uniref:hypothetical protein n=1 Tax=Ralstonia TaxID=48736 RepID=UPI00046A1425|nr:hypothetical protein [Ralstonia pickettii]
MPHPWQRKEIGRRLYAGSLIEKRNTALQLAKRVSAVRVEDSRAAHLVGHARVTTVQQYCEDDQRATSQIDGGREPYLLVEDPYNPGELRPVEIYDRRVDAVEPRTGLCWIHLSRGDALVKPDTLVYWK